MMHSQAAYGLSDYGVCQKTYDRIILGQQLGYDDMMNLEACHVPPQMIVNYLNAPGNICSFKCKHQLYYDPLTEEISQRINENDSHDVLPQHSPLANHELGRSLRHVGGQLRKWANQRKRKYLDSKFSDTSSQNEKMKTPVSRSFFSHEDHQWTRSLDSKVGGAILDMSKKAKKDISQQNINEAHDLVKEFHSKIKSIL